METSKKITFSILILYIVSVIVTYVGQIIWDLDLTFILDYVQKSLVVVLGYFTKAGVENYNKIKGSFNISEDGDDI